MALLVRMVFYYVFAALSGAGWLHFDPIEGVATIRLDELGPALVGGAGFAATYVWSRIAKRRGGKT